MARFAEVIMPRHATAPFARLVLAGLLAAAGTVPAVTSAATWTTPTQAASESSAVSGLRVATNGPGVAVAREAASWVENGHLVANVRDGVANWPAPFHFPAPPAGGSVSNVDVVVALNGDVTLAWLEGAAGNLRLKSAVYRNGAWQVAATLSAQATSAAKMAADADGNVTVAWLQADSVAATCDIRAADAPAGGDFAASALLSHDCNNEIDLAVNSKGDALVAWSNRLVIHGGSPVVAASRSAGGNWGLPVIVAAPTYRSHGARVALADNGRAVALWSDAYGPLYARRNANGKWGVAAQVDPNGGYSYTGDGDVVIDAAGNATAILGTFDPSFSAQELVARRLGNTAMNWGKAVKISPAGAAIDRYSVEATPGGTVIVGWLDGTPSTTTGIPRGVGVSVQENGAWTRQRFATDYREFDVGAAAGGVIAGWNAGKASARVMTSDAAAP